MESSSGSEVTEKFKDIDAEAPKPRFTPEKRFKYGLFLAGVSGISAVAGFGATVAAVKKQDPKYFDKGMMGSIRMQETGASLAVRALGWGTLYAFTGCGILFYSIWKISGASNFDEFRKTVGSFLPKIPKNNPPHGRTEFEGLTDLMQYLAGQKTTKEK